MIFAFKLGLGIDKKMDKIVSYQIIKFQNLIFYEAFFCRCIICETHHFLNLILTYLTIRYLTFFSNRLGGRISKRKEYTRMPKCISFARYNASNEQIQLWDYNTCEMGCVWSLECMKTWTQAGSDLLTSSARGLREMTGRAGPEIFRFCPWACGPVSCLLRADP